MTSPHIRKPVFGEWMRGIYASETNPQRDGMYVRTVRRRAGLTNSGTWYEMTDGKGNFWQYPPESTIFIAERQAARSAVVSDEDVNSFLDKYEGKRAHPRSFAHIENARACLIHFAQSHGVAGAVKVPDGYALVPIEPTNAMLNAFMTKAEARNPADTGYAASKRWKVAIDAATQEKAS